MPNRDPVTGRYTKTPDAIMGFSASKMLGSVGKDLLSFTSKFTTTATDALKQFIGTMKNFLAQLTSLLWTGLTKMLGGVATGIGKMVSLTASLILKGIGTLSGGIVGAMRAVASSLLHSISAVVSTSFTVLINGAKVLVGALAGITLGLTKATQATANYGRSLTDFRASTGMGYGASAGVLNRFGALGISREQTQGTFGAQNPALFGLKASIWGLPGYGSPDLMPQVAGRYQSMMGSGLGGQLLAQQMLGTLGMNSPEMRRAAMTPVSEIRSQMAFQSNVQSTLGVDPRMIADVTRQFDTLTNRLKILSDAALVRLGAEVLPRVNAGLEVLTNTLLNNSVAIGSFITNAVNTSFAALANFGAFMLRLPGVFIGAAQGALAFADSILGFVDTGLSALPQLFDTFLTGVSIVQTAVQPLFNGIASGFDYLAQVVPPIISQAVNGVGTVITLLQNGITGFGNAAVTVFGAVEGALNKILANPTLQSALKAGEAGADIAKTAAQLTEGPRNAIRNGAESMGVKPGNSDLLSFLALPAAALVGKSILGLGSRAIGGVGGAAGASGAASFLPQWIPKFLPMGLASKIPAKGIAGLASRALLNPVGAGLAIGLGGYSALQSRGYLGKDAPGVGEAISNMLARMTGGEVTQQNGYTASQNAARQAPRASYTPVTDKIRSGIAHLQGYSHIPGTLATQYSAGVQRGKQGNGSIAQWMGNNVDVNRLAFEGQQQVNKIRADLRGAAQSVENSEMLKMLANILKALQGINTNTKPNQAATERLEQALKNNGNQVLGHAMNAAAREGALGTLRMGY
jgi:hypothetical protein